MKRELHTRNHVSANRLSLLTFAATGLLTAAPALSASSLDGQVLGGSAPIANSTVTLWAANAGAPKRLGQTRTGADGRFMLTTPSAPADASLYLTAQGGQPTANKAAGNNPAIALITVLGNKPPARVTINEMTTVASVWTHNQFINGTTIQATAAATEDRRRQCAELCRSRHRWLGRYDPGPAQWRPDADDGQFRHAGQCAVRLRNSGEGRCLRFPVRRSQGAGRRNTGRHAERGSGGRQGAVVSAAAGIRTARTVLSDSTGQDHAPGAVHALPAGRTQRLGVAAEIRWRWLPGRRQGDVRRRRQPLGRQQLHHRLAGERRALARQRKQVRPQRQAAVADHDRFCRRWYAGRHLRRRYRPEGQRLACELWQQVHYRIRQERQTAHPARGDQFRWQTRLDAGHHHRAERRHLGAGDFRAPVAAFPEG